MHITKNEIKYIRSLSQKKNRQTEQKFVVEGWRALKEVLNSASKVEIAGVLSRYLDDPDYKGILSKLEERGAVVRELTETELNALADTVHAQGVIAVVQQKKGSLEPDVLKKASLVVVADAVSDPGNLGSIIRSSDWFNIDLLLLGKGCVELHNDKVIRSTVGSIFHLPIVEDIELLSTLRVLKKNGFCVIALSGDGKHSYEDQPMSGKLAIVLGSEAHGVSAEVRTLADDIVRIPKYGKAESLNVGVACGIVLARIRSQRETKKGA
ncbi:MAG: RNA methyltransferase [Ignavibacteriales bacterium]|nr:RNA methyltransferase [Ignavibacteriales bacterium]